MKKLLGILVLGLLWCNVSVKAESIVRLKEINDSLIALGPNTVDYNFLCKKEKEANKILYKFGFSQKIKREWAHKWFGSVNSGKYQLEESLVDNSKDGKTSIWYFLIGSNDNFPKNKEIRKHVLKRIGKFEYKLLIYQVRIEPEAAIYILEQHEKRILDQNPRAATFDEEEFGKATFKITKANEMIFKKHVEAKTWEMSKLTLHCEIYM